MTRVRAGEAAEAMGIRVEEGASAIDGGGRVVVVVREGTREEGMGVARGGIVLVGPEGDVMRWRGVGAARRGDGAAAYFTKEEEAEYTGGEAAVPSPVFFFFFAVVVGCVRRVEAREAGDTPSSSSTAAAVCGAATMVLPRGENTHTATSSEADAIEGGGGEGDRRGGDTAEVERAKRWWPPASSIAVFASAPDTRSTLRYMNAGRGWWEEVRHSCGAVWSIARRSFASSAFLGVGEGRRERSGGRCSTLLNGAWASLRPRAAPDAISEDSSAVGNHFFPIFSFH